MRGYIVQRLLQLIPVSVLITLLVYSMMLLLPGDPIDAIMGPGEALDAQQREVMRRELNLDKPVVVQFGLWLGKVVQGDLGRSTRTKRSVTEELKLRLVVTLQFGFLAWLVSVLIAIPAGIVSAFFRGTQLDLFATAISIGAVAIPGFWLGIMLIYLFGVNLGWLPTHGYVNPFVEPLEGLRHMLLPAFSLGVTGAALIMRQTRSAMLEVLAQDYVRTARAKGLSDRRVLWRHALPNSLLPVVTIMGLQVGRIFSGAVVIESLFAIPGMGRLLVDAVFEKDFPIVQGSVLVMAAAVLAANFATDLAYAFLDPRIRYGS